MLSLIAFIKQELKELQEIQEKYSKAIEGDERLWPKKKEFYGK